MSYIPQLRVVRPLALMALVVSYEAAMAADIGITEARITGGKLVVTGTAAPNAWVRLDGQTGSDFNVKSNADGRFAFGVVYHPGDCVVDLQRLISPTTLGAAVPALVADCGPGGLYPRGSWNAAVPYLTNDLVTHHGSSWRAKRGNNNKPPVAAGADWEPFAAGAQATVKAAQDGPPDTTMAAPDGPAGGDLTGTYPNPTIANRAITNAKIAPLAIANSRLAPNAVTTDKIAPLAIGNGRLAPNAVTTDKIADASITAADLGFNSVNSGEIATDAVNGSEVAANAIDSDEILDNSLGAVDLAFGSVGSSEIADGAVSALEIAANAVNSSKVFNNTITASDLDGGESNGAITLNSGFVANGRCRDVGVSVSGAEVGDAVIFSVSSDLPDGILLYGVRVISDDVIQAKACNFTGAAFPQLNNIQVAIITIAL